MPERLNIDRNLYRQLLRNRTNLDDMPSAKYVQKTVRDIGQDNREVCKGIGNALDDAQDSYLAALSNPKASKAEIATAKMAYEKANECWQAFMQLTTNSFQTVIQAIRQMSVR